jgi:hypothetical protein
MVKIKNIKKCTFPVAIDIGLIYIMGNTTDREEITMTITMHKLPETGWVIEGIDQLDGSHYYNTDRIFISFDEAHKYCSRMENPVKISINRINLPWELDS